ncbi:hypothetical protein ACFPU0_18315 [Pseudomonas sp. GCM10022186]|uniref:hypothetical protein n=1 Tax=Pseudomonas sp. GCM10022186 TaxID=3252650 RepID=UPI0036092F22
MSGIWAGLILALIPLWVLATIVYRSSRARAGRKLSRKWIWFENTLFVVVGLALVLLAFRLD